MFLVLLSPVKLKSLFKPTFNSYSAFYFHSSILSHVQASSNREEVTHTKINT